MTECNSGHDVAFTSTTVLLDNKQASASNEARRHYDTGMSVESDWRPTLRVSNKVDPVASLQRSNSIFHGAIAAIPEIETKGKRYIPPSKECVESRYKPGIRVVTDDNNPGLLRKDRPALELSLESLLNRKRRVPPPASFTAPRATAEHSKGFFKPGGLVPGSSFMFQGKNDSVNRLNDGWKKFLPERPSAVRTYVEVSRARELTELSEDVRALQDWEGSILKAYPDSKFVDPDAGDEDVE